MTDRATTIDMTDRKEMIADDELQVSTEQIRVNWKIQFWQTFHNFMVAIATHTTTYSNTQWKVKIGKCFCIKKYKPLKVKPISILIWMECLGDLLKQYLAWLNNRKGWRHVYTRNVGLYLTWNHEIIHVLWRVKM